MRVFWANFTDIKIGVKLFIRLNPIGPSPGLWNEVLGIHAAQGTAKLLEVKVWGPKWWSYLDKIESDLLNKV